ncbi:MAG: hypothetical protein ABFD62_05300 [Syntrophaceae bacterium]
MLMRANYQFEVFRRDMLNITMQVLPRMYLQDRLLFCTRAPLVSGGLQPQDVSVRYTLITILGLKRLAEEGIEILDYGPLLAGIAARREAIRGGGDLGLLLWACALIDPGLLQKLLDDNLFIERLGDAPDIRGGFTMETAWLLSSLAHAADRLGELPPGARALAQSAFNRLKRNYGGRGIFGHQGRNTFGGFLAGRIGTFADQAYPMYALAKYGRACGVEEALQTALECARAACSLQGPQGQWWWHFDQVTGRRIGRYPVYSVHQYGMAPMALAAVSSATGADFSAPVYKGLEWLTENNELRTSMIDRQVGTIWRCMYKGDFTARLEEAASLAGLPVNDVNPRGPGLKILHESRPYCFGWLLYALAGESDFRILNRKSAAL